MPACASVRSHKASTQSVMMPSTRNSPTTYITGLDMYTITTRMSSRKILRRNSKRLLPSNIAFAYTGLMDKTAWVGFGELEDRAELVFREGLKAPWRAVDVADNPIVDTLLQVRSFRE